MRATRSTSGVPAVVSLQVHDGNGVKRPVVAAFIVFDRRADGAYRVTKLRYTRGTDLASRKTVPAPMWLAFGNVLYYVSALRDFVYRDSVGSRMGSQQ